MDDHYAVVDGAKYKLYHADWNRDKTIALLKELSLGDFETKN